MSNTSSRGVSRLRFSRSLINFLRGCRTVLYFCLSPLDYLARVLNNKGDFPPLYLRRHVGPLRTFEASGSEFFAYLRLLARLKSNDRILDIGCGCGLMVFQLFEFLDESASYAGVDLHQASIRWCNTHLSRSNFEFTHLDIRSEAYNPDGQLRGDQVVLPYDANHFDVVLCKSIFTHVGPAELENYLRETARLLKDDGRCLATFFLLNREQDQLQQQGRNALEFNFGATKEWRYVYEHSPESASAYEENYVLELLEKCGLTLDGPVHYGTWSGRHDGLSFQDILIVRKCKFDRTQRNAQSKSNNSDRKPSRFFL